MVDLPMKTRSTVIVAVASVLLGACAAIPPNSEYLSCAGSTKYKVCKRYKDCGPGNAVLIEDHFFDGKLHKTVEPACPD
jgi:hypothetical protein